MMFMYYLQNVECPLRMSLIPKTSIQFAVVEGNVDPKKLKQKQAFPSEHFSYKMNILQETEHRVKDCLFVSNLLNANARPNG